MIYHDKVFVLYNDKLKIVKVFEPNLPPMSPQQFKDMCFCTGSDLENDDPSNYGVIVHDRKEYKNAMKNINDYILEVDPVNNKIIFHLKKNFIKNTTYDVQHTKRDFSVDEIKKMYYDYYVNFNIKNFVKSKNLDIGFKYVKDLKVRTHMLNKNWNYFHYDPFLVDSAKDRLNLGRDIVKNGCYYPFVVAPLVEDKPDQMYVFEGNHRLLSLKLMQHNGELPEDYKVLCICYPENYEKIQDQYRFSALEHPFKLRGIIELIYGEKILLDSKQYQLALDTLKKDGGRMIDDYTVEWTGTNYDDALFALQTYAHWLRDPIHRNQDIFTPAKQLNDEKAFEEWINES